MTTFALENGRTKLPNGTVLMFGIRYAGRTTERVFTYVMFKAGGLWYVTGNGRVPTAAAWPAIERWLAKDGREVIWVRTAVEWTEVWSSPNQLTP
jgi:hypothetical protein